MKQSHGLVAVKGVQGHFRMADLGDRAIGNVNPKRQEGALIEHLQNILLRQDSLSIKVVQ